MHARLLSAKLATIKLPESTAETTFYALNLF